MKFLRKIASKLLFVLLLAVLGWGTQGCVKADTRNSADPSNSGSGWFLWFFAGEGTCKFDQNTFSDACIIR